MILKNKSEKLKKKKSNPAAMLCLCGMAAAMCASLFLCGYEHYGRQNEDYLKPETSVKPVFTTEDRERMEYKQTPYEQRYYEIRDDDMNLFYTYREMNDEVVGVITIPGTTLHHPLMQSPKRGESFYLSHDLSLNHNFHGVPFLTLNSDLSGEEGNNIIYGHNIIHTEPKDVFCDLVGYEDIAYYKAHPVIEIVTDKGTAKYLIFVYAIMDISDADSFVYWEDTVFDDERAFDEYMSKMQERNWLSVDMPYTRYDAFVTISTCSLELAHSGTNRMVVMARRIPVDEDYKRYVNAAKMSENPLLPQKLR